MTITYRHLILQLILLTSIDCFGQIGSERLRVDSTSKFVTIIGQDFKGAIVSKEIELGFNKNELSIRFNPTLQEIVVAENGLTNYYNKAMINDSRVSGFSEIKDVRSNFKDYTRQYLGYINEKNERVIWIHLIRVEKLKKAFGKDDFDWKSNIIFGLGDIFYENMITMIFNLDNNKLSLW